MKLDPEGRKKAIEAAALALGGGTNDPLIWDMHIAVCEETVDEALTTYLDYMAAKGVRMMPREPNATVMSDTWNIWHSLDDEAWEACWDAHAAEQDREEGDG